MAMLSERRAPAPSSNGGSSPGDRCGFGREFDLTSVACPAFQRAQFVAATSYGKPLATHVACAHLMVGELSTNQYYPRCSLGSDSERMRWLAMMGPGRIEVLRALNAEFERRHSGSLQQLVTAKAMALAEPPEAHEGRAALAARVQDFVSEVTAFVNTHAARIADLGISPADITARVAQALSDWQHGSRLDLPGLDEQSILRSDGPHEAQAAESVAGTSRGMTPRALR
jgi:hypothetical protein